MYKYEFINQPSRVVPLYSCLFTWAQSGLERETVVYLLLHLHKQQASRQHTINEARRRSKSLKADGCKTFDRQSSSTSRSLPPESVQRVGVGLAERRCNLMILPGQSVSFAGSGSGSGMLRSVSDVAAMLKRNLQSTDSSQKTKAAIVSRPLMRAHVPHPSDMYDRLLAVSAPPSCLPSSCSSS